MVSIRRSLAISFLRRYTGMAVGVVSTIVLARLLTPEEIGLYAVVASLTPIANHIREFGVGRYLIQTTELTEDNVRTAFTLTLVIAWSIAVLFFIFSPFVAEVFDESTVQQILMVLARCHSHKLGRHGCWVDEPRMGIVEWSGDNGWNDSIVSAGRNGISALVQGMAPDRFVRQHVDGRRFGGLSWQRGDPIHPGTGAWLYGRGLLQQGGGFDFDIQPILSQIG